MDEKMALYKVWQIKYQLCLLNQQLDIRVALRLKKTVILKELAYDDT
jgi:hypothetical protein